MVFDGQVAASVNSPSVGFGWFDVLVDPEKVCRIVFLLQHHKAFIVLSVGFSNSLFSLLAKVVHVSVMLAERLHRCPRYPRPANILFGVRTVVPSRHCAAVVVVVTMRESGLGGLHAACHTMKLLQVEEAS